MDYYILVNDEPILCRDLEVWAKFMDSEIRIIRQTKFDGVFVSTVFLGIDHSFVSKQYPVLFETMIFGGAEDEYQERYWNMEDAKKGHVEAVRYAKKLLRMDNA